MGTLHLAVNVFAFFLTDSAPLDGEEDYLLLTWSDSKWAHLVHCEEIFYSELELLTPFMASRVWIIMLGYGPRCLAIAQQLITVVRS